MEKEYKLIDPPIDDLVKIVGNKFELTTLMSKRAKAMSNAYSKRGEPLEKDPKFICIAADEIYEGKVIATREEVK